MEDTGYTYECLLLKVSSVSGLHIDVCYIKLRFKNDNLLKKRELGPKKDEKFFLNYIIYLIYYINQTWWNWELYINGNNGNHVTKVLDLDPLNCI